MMKIPLKNASDIGIGKINERDGIIKIPIIEAFIGNQKLDMIVDTGATRTVIREEYLVGAKMTRKIAVRCWNGNVISAYLYECIIKINNTEYTTEVLKCNERPSLLGMDIIQHLNIQIVNNVIIIE